MGAARPAGRSSGRGARAPVSLGADLGSLPSPNPELPVGPSSLSCPRIRPPRRCSMRLAHTPLLALGVLSLAAPPASAQSLLKLNEFVAGPARDWDGSGAISTRDDEWIEIVNTGGSPVDLTGYLLTDGDKLPRFAYAGSLAGNGVRVVYGKESVDWERASGNPVFGLSLANTGDSVMLWHVTG